MKLVADTLDVNFVYDPQAPQIARGKIEIEGTVTLAKSELFDWARALFFTHRMVFVPVGLEKAETWSVVDLNSPLVTQRPIFVDEKDIDQWRTKAGAYIVTSVKLSHLRDTSRIRNALAQLSTRMVGRINDNPATASVVIGDFAPVVYAQVKLLRETDAAAAADGAARAMTADPLIKNYEQKLAQCHTETAAKYFVGRIQSLLPKK
jgi:hypothetical protein